MSLLPLYAEKLVGSEEVLRPEKDATRYLAKGENSVST